MAELRSEGMPHWGAAVPGVVIRLLCKVRGEGGGGVLGLDMEGLVAMRNGRREV